MCVVSVMKSFIEGLVELAYFALLYDHLVASVMKLAISVIESAFRLHSDSVILSAVSVMIFVNFGSTNNLFPFSSRRSRSRFYKIGRMYWQKKWDGVI